MAKIRQKKKAPKSFDAMRDEENPVPQSRARSLGGKAVLFGRGFPFPHRYGLSATSDSFSLTLFLATYIRIDTGPSSLSLALPLLYVYEQASNSPSHAVCCTPIVRPFSPTGFDIS
ncbi:hypothetical protein CDAR_493351 [Caerostris darwini]|uniref:Uncharacterized protein n=1 Tax=Caerostris darwini TaxID=1538125 RepID=A0AAV4RXR0_9ARAC|nr:hypothetical protein CDAR_493351 [Caerostris darwini]